MLLAQRVPGRPPALVEMSERPGVLAELPARLGKDLGGIAEPRPFAPVEQHQPHERVQQKRRQPGPGQHLHQGHSTAGFVLEKGDLTPGRDVLLDPAPHQHHQVVAPQAGVDQQPVVREYQHPSLRERKLQGDGGGRLSGEGACSVGRRHGAPAAPQAQPAAGPGSGFGFAPGRRVAVVARNAHLADLDRAAKSHLSDQRQREQRQAPAANPAQNAALLAGRELPQHHQKVALAELVRVRDAPGLVAQVLRQHVDRPGARAPAGVGRRTRRGGRPLEHDQGDHQRCPPPHSAPPYWVTASTSASSRAYSSTDGGLCPRTDCSAARVTPVSSSISRGLEASRRTYSQLVVVSSSVR